MAALILTAASTPAAFAETYVQTSMADDLDVQKFQSAPKPARMSRPKIGLCLGGGGTRGAAHVGVLEVLEKEGIKYDYIDGTSIGAVVGGLYDAGVPLEMIEKDFVSGRMMRNFMTMSLPVRVVFEPIFFFPRILGAKPYDGLYKGSNFRKYLDKTLPGRMMKIEELKIPFAAVSLNVLDGYPYMIRSGDLGYAMQASSAVPALRKPVEIGDGLFVDGGTICNLPVKQCREMGADIVIAVNVDKPFQVEPKDVFRKPGSVSDRMLNWSLWEVDRRQAKLADVEIHPDVDHIDLVSTSKADAKRAFEAGRDAAIKALPQIREKLKSLGVASTGGSSTASSINSKSDADRP
jgi:NTE family protein